MADKLSRDPYKTFRFLVKWEGQSDPVAGVNSVSALKQTTETIEYRAGNDPLQMKCMPGQTNYEPVTLERGLTLNSQFHDWAQKLSADGYADDLRKNVDIVLCDPNGIEGIAFKLTNCWVSEYTALPGLDSGDNGVAIESLTFEHEGWPEEDWSVAAVK